MSIYNRDGKGKYTKIGVKLGTAKRKEDQKQIE
jgi:hypothetical protein